MSEPAQNHLLIYTYVEDMLAKRGPHREAHLARIEAARQDGKLLIGGAFGDPPSGAAIGFTGMSREQVEAWAAADPYVLGGLVRERRIEPWTLV